ncbi:MAG: nuclear transport factor 2 family protein [Anaerolineales bacterium]|jgi:ketosteroid isomerase-like protein
MSGIDPKLIVLQFNQYINDRDISGLSTLMSEDYVFIDGSDDVHAGKEKLVEGWTEFFNSYPDYRNHFSLVESRDNLVLIIGHSTCSYDPLDGPALWTAKVENDLVSEWRVYLDTTENRKKLNLPPQPEG